MASCEQHFNGTYNQSTASSNIQSINFTVCYRKVNTTLTTLEHLYNKGNCAVSKTSSATETESSEGKTEASSTNGGTQTSDGGVDTQATNNNGEYIQRAK